MAVHIDAAIARYEHLLRQVEDTVPGAGSSGLLNLLRLRDELQGLIQSAESLRTQELNRLVALDERLKKIAAKTPKNSVDWTFLKQWRASVGPPAEHWWWNLDEFAPKAQEEYGFLSLLTVVLFTVSIVIATKTVDLLKEAGAGLVFFFGTFFQAILTVISGSALTDAGRKWLMKITGFTSDRPKLYGCIVALLAVLLSLSLKSFLPPVMAKHYLAKAKEYEKAESYSEAIRNFERSVKFDPENPETRRNLALVYDRMNERDKAVKEYEECIRLRGKYFEVYNNLSRLYNLRKEHQKALRVLKEAMENGDLEDLASDKQYYLQKNRGWANLELKNFTMAEVDLKVAIAFQNDAPSAHFLLGRVYGEQKKSVAQLSEYRVFLNCIAEHSKKKAKGIKVPEQDWEPEWEATAHELLRTNPS
jgi:Tfp pilus assembly protein PilF